MKHAIFGQYDTIVVSGIGATTYGLLSSVLARSPVVFDDHNVEHELARSEGSLLRFCVVYLLERVACAASTLVVVPTQETRSALDPWVTGEIQIVANGFDDTKFTLDGPSAERAERSVLFFGNFGYGPNRDALEYILKELCPALDRKEVDADILLAGAKLDAVETPGKPPDRVELLGFVDDLPTLVRGVDVVVVPIKTGSGSRLKIIESLACGTKVVSTPAGATGWPREWENLVVVELEEFPEAVEAVIEDPVFDTQEYEEILTYSWQTQSTRFVEYIESTCELTD